MDEPGTLIEGKYEVLEKLREGGMGAVYKVHHRLLDQVRVIKVLKPDFVASDEMRHRFLAEAKTATRLKHPNIAAVYDFDIDKTGRAFIVMEYIDGLTLKEILKAQGTPELSVTLEAARQTLLALGYLHKRKVVHRDVAADNIMLTSDEAGHPRVKLIDLGIAKQVDKGPGITAAGMFVGKLSYASPELLGALAPGEKLDGRSDLYSLGVVLYELLTGVRPFTGESAAGFVQAHLEHGPLPFAQSDPLGRVPEDVRKLVRRALERRRVDRYPSAEDMATAVAELQRRHALPGADEKTIPHFAEHLEKPPPAEPAPPAEAAPLQAATETGPAPILPPAGAPKSRRSWLLAAGLGALAVLALLLGRALLVSPKEEPIAPPTAQPAPTAAAVATPLLQPTEPPPTPAEPTPAPTLEPTAAPTSVPAAVAEPTEAATATKSPRPAPTRARPRPTRAAPSPSPTPLPTRAEPTPPRPGPAKPSPADEAAIRESVMTYARAFAALHSQRRELDIVSIEVTGATALVRCLDRPGPAAGGSGAGPRPTTVRLQKRGESWSVTGTGR